MTDLRQELTLMLSTATGRAGGGVLLAGDNTIRAALLCVLCYLTDANDESASVRHVLLEGANGTGKNVLVRNVFRAIAGPDLCEFYTRCGWDGIIRIQGRPDLTPQDVIGGDALANEWLWDRTRGRYYVVQRLKFFEGPLLKPGMLHFVDELNRTPPRTQSAYLDAMCESRATLVTVDERIQSVDRQLPDLFMVAAQNPSFHEGTFPLPEAMLDRFMIKCALTYTPSMRDLIVDTDKSARETIECAERSQALLDQEVQLRSQRMDTIHAIREAIKQMPLDGVSGAIEDLVTATRKRPRQAFGPWVGASPRGAQALRSLSRAVAWTKNHDKVELADVVEVAPDTLRHRVSSINPESLDGLDTIKSLLEANTEPGWHVAA